MTSSRLRVKTGDVAAAAMHLDPGSVELPLHRRRHDPVECRDQVGRRRGQHRLHRPADDQPHAAQALDTVAEADLGQRAGISQQHQRPPHLLHRHVDGEGDGVGDHGLKRALPQVAQHQPAQEVLLVGNRPAEQAVEQSPALGLRAGSGHRSQPVEGGVDVSHRELGLSAAGGVSRRLAQPTPSRRCRGSPVRNDTPAATSSAPSRAIAAASRRIFSVRAGVRVATAADVVTISRSSIPG